MNKIIKTAEEIKWSLLPEIDGAKMGTASQRIRNNKLWADVEKLEKELLKEFNWRWKAFLRGEYTQQQFSTMFRKYIKKLPKEGQRQ